MCFMQNDNKNSLKKRAFKPYILLQAVHLCTQMRKNGKFCSRQIFRFCLLGRLPQTLRTEISFLSHAPNWGFLTFVQVGLKLKRKILAQCCSCILLLFNLSEGVETQSGSEFDFPIFCWKIRRFNFLPKWQKVKMQNRFQKNSAVRSVAQR